MATPTLTVSILLQSGRFTDVPLTLPGIPRVGDTVDVDGYGLLEVEDVMWADGSDTVVLGVSYERASNGPRYRRVAYQDGCVDDTREILPGKPGKQIRVENGVPYYMAAPETKPAD